MIKLIIKNLDNIQVATVTSDLQGKCVINTDNDSVKEKIQEILSRASKVGIPLRSDTRQYLEQGIRYKRLACWLKPGDKDFLQAVADDLIRHQLLGYTVESNNN
jgi:hypothetical protein